MKDNENLHIDSPLDQNMVEGILHPEHFVFLSFYPSPMCCEISKDLTSLGITDRGEILERCKHRIYKDGTQEWILDGKEVLFRANPHTATNDKGDIIEGILALQFEMPFRKNKKNK